MTTPTVHRFFSEGAWVEGVALSQLDTLAASSPDIQAIAAMPDLHPGKYGPVGIGMLSDDIHPAIVGSDIGCGMGLFRTDLSVRKFKAEKIAERLNALDEPWDGDRSDWLDGHGVNGTIYDGSLGTIGSGNHFCEFQAVHEVMNEAAFEETGIERDRAVILVHSGSRAYGYGILEEVLANGRTRLSPESQEGQDYLAAHDNAVRWAAMNRAIIADRAADAARDVIVETVANIPHNFLERHWRGILHRKGAAPADRGLVPIPGSRETLSYLVRPLPMADPHSLATLAHGAGRKYDRASMHGRIEKVKSVREGMKRNPFGGIVVCEDRALMLEEAGAAYKNIDAVIEQMVEFGLIEVVATFRPLITFKTGLAHIGDKGKDRR